MAIKAMRCTQCGAQLELDDQREFGFCSHCGTKLMLRETVNVKHSGTVQLDTSGRAGNRLRLADQACEAGNWSEAYNYYTKVLEDDADNYWALYRKGICAVILSEPENLRTPELKLCAGEGRRILDGLLAETEDGSEREKALLAELLVQERMMHQISLNILEDCRSRFYVKLSSKNEGHAQAARQCEAAKLLEVATDLLHDSELKEELLDKAVRFCDEALNTRVQVYTHTTTDKKGNRKDHFEPYVMDSGRRSIITGCRSTCAERYNTLPSRLEKMSQMESMLGELDSQRGELKNAMDAAQGAFDNAAAAFWQGNPELLARRSKRKNLSWIAVGVGVAALAASLFMMNSSILYPIVGAALAVVSFFIKKSIAKSAVAKLEEQVFPPEVKALREGLFAAQDNWATKQREFSAKQAEKASFVASQK